MTVVYQVDDQVGTVVYQLGAKVSQTSPEYYQVGKTDYLPRENVKPLVIVTNN